MSELVTQSAIDFIKSRLSEKEQALLRAMAQADRYATTKDDLVIVRSETFREPELVMALEGRLQDHGYVGRNKDGGNYFLTPKGVAAAFAPRLGNRTWLEIALLSIFLALICSAASVVLWNKYGPSKGIKGEKGDVGAAGPAGIDGKDGASTIDFPIGSIIAWHRDIDTSRKIPQKLPLGWQECNGKLILEGPLSDRGLNTPNLNSAEGYEGGRFLRGTPDQTGTLQEATFVLREMGETEIASFSRFVHTYDPGTLKVGPTASGARAASDKRKMGGDTTTQEHTNSIVDPKLTISPEMRDRTNKLYDAMRPVNMGVIWIMRIY